MRIGRRRFWRSSSDAHSGFIAEDRPVALAAALVVQSGTLLEALHEIHALSGRAALATLLHAVGAVGRIGAQRLFDRRPELLLLGCELEAGLDRGDARVGQRVEIGARHRRAVAHSARASLRRRSRLGIGHRPGDDQSRSGRNESESLHAILLLQTAQSIRR